MRSVVYGFPKLDFEWRSHLTILTRAPNWKDRGDRSCLT
jgi:hypothetical protein